jgi:hypothetical protein
VYMNTRKKKLTNNERLRQLLEEEELTQARALELFNKGLPPMAQYSMHTWKAYFTDPESTRFRSVSDQLLAHAEKQLSNAPPKVPGEDMPAWLAPKPKPKPKLALAKKLDWVAPKKTAAKKKAA